MPVSVNSGWIAFESVAIVFMIFYPLVLAILARRRLGVSWRYFGYGALIFFLFQLISRVPLVTILGNVLAPQLASSRAFLLFWLIALPLTAALFEEIGRYVGYRWLMRKEEKTWDKAVMYGLGHGGLESIVLVGGLGLVSLVNILVLSNINLNMLPASQHAQVLQQLAAIHAQPAWFPLLGAWERLWTVPFHVAMSVIVLQVFRRGQIRWLWLAVLLHTLLDLSATLLPQWLGSGFNTSLLLEGVVALFGVLSVWIIWRLRDRMVEVTVPTLPAQGMGEQNAGSV
jgi:uncharacterized membrane protein YhfC